MGAHYRGGSQRHGSKSHPYASFIRFTEKEQKDLKQLLRKRGMTMQTFAHAAVIRAINEANLGKKADGEIDREEPKQPEPQVGLGIRDRLTVDHDDDDYSDRRSHNVPSVSATVNTPVLAQARTIDDEIVALARTVVETPKASRRDVLKAACRTISRGRTEAESVRLAEDLDAAIERISGQPQQSVLERVRARAGR